MKKQFNQVSPEHDLKWQLVHSHAAAQEYDFGPADTFVSFGLSNMTYVVGHTLVWHSQTPNRVFAGTNPAPRTLPQRRRTHWVHSASGETVLALGASGRLNATLASR